MRSLILAGGGIKVGFQAGVLQVWLDEAGLCFDHADGASGGCFNLAMYCQGMSGTEIADNWRNLDPTSQIDLNWEHYFKLSHVPSLFTLDAYRQKVLPAWGIDWEKIRASPRLGTFNVCNFSRKENVVVTNDRMSEDFLIASVSLPMWFPPVVIDGETWLDAVFLTDANVEEAIRRGADEIWAIWTVSTRDEWHDGFVAQYFQIVEIAADGRFFPIWRRIEESNAEIAAGRPGEFGRHVELRLLQAEVPVHYLINVSRDRMRAAVELGVERAREWCREHGVPLRQPAAVVATKPRVDLEFTESMKGRLTPGESDFERGAKAPGRQRLSFLLTIEMHDLDRFLVDPHHQAKAVGSVDFAPFGGRREVEQGWFNLLVHEDDPSRKKMLYRLFFRDGQGNPWTFTGYKDVRDHQGIDVWKDTTTLMTRLYRGHVPPGEDERAELYGSGVLTLSEVDFLKQLGTFRVTAPSLEERNAALARFGKFFLGSLWDVYARPLSPYRPHLTHAQLPVASGGLTP